MGGHVKTLRPDGRLALGIVGLPRRAIGFTSRIPDPADQHRLRRTHEAAVGRADRASQLAGRREAVLGRVTDTRADRFAMTVDGHHHTKRVEAGAHLQRCCSTTSTAPHPSRPA